MNEYEETKVLESALAYLKALGQGYSSMHRSEMEACQVRENATIEPIVKLISLALRYDGILDRVGRYFRAEVVLLAARVIEGQKS